MKKMNINGIILLNERRKEGGFSPDDGFSPPNALLNIKQDGTRIQVRMQNFFLHG